MKSFVLVVMFASGCVTALAQFGRGGPPQPPRPAREAAPVDLTGYWVSVVSEDYRWRMVTPAKGDAQSIPFRVDARKIIDAWDPAKDEAAGLQCKAYGAAAIMRRPGRLHITWQDENTLKIETSEGQQTRLLHFGARPPANEAASWQGFSSARWEPPIPPRGNAIPLGVSRIGTASKALEVHTANLREGYLRKNGLPYSERTTVDEYFDLFTEPSGATWFTVTTIVTDPVNLTTPFVTSSDFRKEPDGSKFQASACNAR
jgi:hypothetical protein